MSIQSDRWIREQSIKHRMIEPFCEKQINEGVISYGLSSYGYDLRVSDEFKIFTNVNSAIIDPKAFDERSFVSVQGRLGDRASEFVRIGSLDRIFSYPQGCTDDLRWKVDLCALRNHRERDAIRAGVGGFRDP